MTAIAEKLAAKGVIPRNVKFQIALAEFQNNGGEYGVALAMLNAAYGRGTEANSSAPRGQQVVADVPQQNDGEGQQMHADKADRKLPSPSADRSAGHVAGADEADGVVPVAANKPGHAKRGLHAIGAVQATVSKSLFDTTVLPDGRRLREVRWSELVGLSTKYRRLSRVLIAIRNHGTPIDPDATVDTFLKEERLAEIVAAVEVVNDIA